jgi:hypothetical protein
MKSDELQRKLQDAMVPGVIVAFDPEEADLVGAFVEDALSEEDALASAVDLVPVSEVS